jgi:hypothetical protein
MVRRKDGRVLVVSGRMQMWGGRGGEGRKALGSGS